MNVTKNMQYVITLKQRFVLEKPHYLMFSKISRQFLVEELSYIFSDLKPVLNG